MLNKNGSSTEYHLKFGISHPSPSDEEVQEFLDEMKRRASDRGIIISEKFAVQTADPNQMRLFE